MSDSKIIALIGVCGICALCAVAALKTKDYNPGNGASCIDGVVYDNSTKLPAVLGSDEAFISCTRFIGLGMKTFPTYEAFLGSLRRL